MDNITHTLVGAALAEAGLKKRTALAGATLMIAANFPDIDVVALFFGTDTVSFRRGITHGFPALIVLPFVLAGIVWVWDSYVRRPRENGKDPVDFRQLVIISAGFDAHMRDPLANLNLLEADFAWATRKLMEVADKYAQGRVVSVLEGGYDLQGLAGSAAAHVAALMQG